MPAGHRFAVAFIYKFLMSFILFYRIESSNYQICIIVIDVFEIQFTKIVILYWKGGYRNQVNKWLYASANLSESDDGVIYCSYTKNSSNIIGEWLFIFSWQT